MPFAPRTSRRDWLTQQAVTAAALAAPHWRLRAEPGTRAVAAPPSQHAVPIAVLAPGLMQRLALQGVDAARSAGAQYADVRLTRTVHHHYNMAGPGSLMQDDEEVGVGVRVLVNGYWGFAASPYWSDDEVVRLARAAAAIAIANAKGPARVVELGVLPAVTGTWHTPMRIDPFTVPIEEKLDHILYWKFCAEKAGTGYDQAGSTSWLGFARQERVLATSAGTLVTQTLYETGSNMKCIKSNDNSIVFDLKDIDWAGQGWERFLDAKIPEQFAPRLAEAIERSKIGVKPVTLGRYTLVCDGATTANLLGATLGKATQLDRALGYEANAGGTSFITDPFGMVGTFQVASPLVTVTANRTAPAHLATVQWDDEGVVATADVPLVKAGVLVDFQTTREGAGWLAPYYTKQGHPIRSNSCAGAQDALAITMQHMPNLTLAPSSSAITTEDLVADVAKGILIERGGVWTMDFQTRNGMFSGAMREITNGRLGRNLSGGIVQFNTLDFWKHLVALGGPSTQATASNSRWSEGDAKGQPVQLTSYSVRACAATIPGQAVIDPMRKA